MKFQSGCNTWKSLTALNYHFATQCIPTPLAWYAHNLPPILLQLSNAAMFCIQIPLAIWIILPIKELELTTFLFQVLLQFLIFLTGNYNFFNILTALLVLPLLFSPVWNVKQNSGTSKRTSLIKKPLHLSVIIMASLLVFVFIIAFFSVKIPKSWNGVNSAYEIKMAVRMPLRFFNAYVVKGGLVLSLCIFSLVFTIASLCYPVAVFKHSKGVSKLSNLTRSLVVVTACTFVFGATIYPLCSIDNELSEQLPSVFLQAYSISYRFSIANPYGLFRRMTGVGKQGEVARPEVILEGTSDGVSWREFNFLYKPGNVYRAPPFIAPHQPRLDWQMWFAALGTHSQNPWLVHLIVKILQGSEEVMSLLDKDPFPDGKPVQLRAQLYHYDFTRDSNSTKWWRRQYKQEYFPRVSLDNRSLSEFIQKYFHYDPRRGVKKVKLLIAGRRSKAITTIEHWVRKGEKSLSDFRQHAVELLFVPATFIVLSVLYEAMGLLPIF